MALREVGRAHVAHTILEELEWVPTLGAERLEQRLLVASAPQDPRVHRDHSRVEGGPSVHDGRVERLGCQVDHGPGAQVQERTLSKHGRLDKWPH
eukprot:CAMPEP_0119419884 /NCGR_PEP_ID=MMETSP1335-20130426/22025_1 /TAXON_ID=259385 /ORGANISM="Chrysoculter rhomboideus, Strain RCC1486" /LENGTH=94 /DNA_ID=CAMNT_0007445213 /DNA_START=264 /DNA_END=548 /DNA_ORIENTATION=-